MYRYWKRGDTFVLTLCEFLNKTMWNQCVKFENIMVEAVQTYIALLKKTHIVLKRTAILLKIFCFM